MSAFCRITVLALVALVGSRVRTFGEEPPAEVDPSVAHEAAAREALKAKDSETAIERSLDALSVYALAHEGCEDERAVRLHLLLARAYESRLGGIGKLMLDTPVEARGPQIEAIDRAGALYRRADEMLARVEAGRAPSDLRIGLLQAWARFEAVQRDNVTGAVRLSRRAFAAYVQAHPERDENFAKMQLGLASAVGQVRATAEALSLVASAVEILERGVSPGSEAHARLRLRLAEARLRDMQTEAALPDLEEGHRILLATRGEGDSWVAEVEGLMISAYRGLGRFTEALRLIEKRMARGKEKPSSVAYWGKVVTTLRELEPVGELLKSASTLADADALEAEANEIAELDRNENDSNLRRFLEGVLDRVLDLRRANGAHADAIVRALAARGRIRLFDATRVHEARADLDEAVALVERTAPPDPLALAKALLSAGYAAAQAGDPGAARGSYTRALGLLPKEPSSDAATALLRLRALGGVCGLSLVLGEGAEAVAATEAYLDEVDRLAPEARREAGVDVDGLITLTAQLGLTALARRAATLGERLDEERGASWTDALDEAVHLRLESILAEASGELETAVSLSRQGSTAVAKVTDPRLNITRARLTLEFPLREGEVLTELGRDQEARAVLEALSADIEAEAPGDFRKTWAFPAVNAALARLHLAEGNLDAALARAERAWDMMDRLREIPLGRSGPRQSPGEEPLLFGMGFRRDRTTSVGVTFDASPELVLARVLLARGTPDAVPAVLTPVVERLERSWGVREPTLAEPLLLLARAELALDRPAEARAHAQRSLDLRRSDGEHLDAAELFLLLGDVELRAGAAGLALKHYDRALAILVRFAPHDEVRIAEAHGRRGRGLEVAGRPEEAHAAFETALSVAERSLGRSEGGRTLQEKFRLSSTLRWALDAYLSVAGVAGERAYEPVLRFKGLVIRATGEERRANRHLPEGAKAAAEALQESRRRLARLAQQAPVERWRRLRWLERYAAASAAVARATRELEARLPARSASDAVTLAAAQRALAHDEAVIDLLFHGAGAAAFVFRREGPVARVDLGSAQVLEARIAAWRKELLGGGGGGETALALRRALWAPLEAHLPAGVGHLYIVPDGALATIPWHALPASAEGGVLAERYAISHLAHVQELLETHPAVTSNGLLAVGGVDYRRAAGTDASARPRRVPGEAAPVRYRALPATLPEAEGVIALVRARDPGVAVELLSGEAATESAVRRMAPGRRTVHLATHGYVRSDLPTLVDVPLAAREAIDPRLLAESVGHDPLLLTGVALAGANRLDGGAGDDGLLTAYECETLPLEGTELVVLSACDTAGGQARAGEGVLGLVRAFRWAGARRVVASLWPVDDEATHRFMAEFYARCHSADAPESPAVSLRHAALALRSVTRDPRAGTGASGPATPWSAPRHWAAFVVYGPR